MTYTNLLQILLFPTESWKHQLSWVENETIVSTQDTSQTFFQKYLNRTMFDQVIINSKVGCFFAEPPESKFESQCDFAHQSSTATDKTSSFEQK